MTDSFDIRNSAFGVSPIHHLAPQGMVGRCEVGTSNFEFQSSRFFRSTFEIQHSSFSPSSNQSGEGTIRQALIEADLRWQVPSSITA